MFISLIKVLGLVCGFKVLYIFFFFLPLYLKIYNIYNTLKPQTNPKTFIKEIDIFTKFL